MKKMLHKTLAALGAAAALLFASCADITEAGATGDETTAVSAATSDGSTRLVISLGETESDDSRTILPSYAKSDLTDIKLYGLISTSPSTLSASDDYLLASWDNYAALMKDEGVILNEYDVAISGTWNFMLTASSNGATMTATASSVTISASAATTVAFDLTASTSVGKVQVDFTDLEYLSVAGIKYYWSSSLVAASSYVDSATALTLTTASDGETTACLEKTDVTAGNYYLTLWFYDEDGDLLLQPWQTAVVVKAGALSYKALSPSVLLSDYVSMTVYTVTYDANGGTGTSYAQSYYPQSTLATVSTASLTAPDGKKFRGWNTKADGTGTRYSPGDNPTLKANTTLYAQWATYDSTNSVYTLSSADDFWAFFSYSEDKASTWGSSSYPVQLTADVTDLTSWIPVSYYGTFDGNAKSLTYTVSSSASVTALFATLGGTVKNVTLTGLELSSAKDHVAGLAAVGSSATVTGVTLANSSLTATASGAYLAGLLAEASSGTTVSGCTIKGMASAGITLTGSKAAYIGGIVGYASYGTTTSTNAVQFVTITGGTSTSYATMAGGVAGYCKNTMIVSPTAVYNTITARYAGGIAGYADATSYGSSTYPISAATVTSNSTYPITGYYAGAVAGYNAAYISNPVITAAVVTTETSGAYLGGIAGYNIGTLCGNGSTANVSSATLTGSTYATYVGGAAGYNAGTVSATVVDGTNTLSGSKAYVGGLVGYNGTATVSSTSYTGTIASTCSVGTAGTSMSISGKYYGYVIAKNDSGTVSEDVTCAYSTTTTYSSVSVSGTSTYYTVTLARTSKLTLTVTDASGQGKLDFAIAKTSGYSTSSSIVYYENLDASTATISAGYLEAGTYYINMYENYALGSCTATTIAYTVD